MEILTGFEKERVQKLSWWESQFKIAHYVSNFIILSLTRLYFFWPERCDGEHNREN